MCEASSSIRQWMEQPIAPRQEAQKFALVTAIAIAIFAFGAFWYTYGVTSPLYNHTVAYVMWGSATVLALSFLTVYVARAIISRNSRINQIREWTRQYRANYSFFLGDLPPSQLSDYKDLKGTTVLFDQHENLNFDRGPIIRGTVGGDPFLAVCLRFSDRPNPVIFLIGPNNQGQWFAYCSDDRVAHHANLMQVDLAETVVFRNWLDIIMKGDKTTSLIRLRGNQPSTLVQWIDGPKVTLWRD